MRKNRFMQNNINRMNVEEDQYQGLPGAVFDKDIFKYLSKDSGNLNTDGRQQYYHSITMFPYDVKNNKIDMTTYLYNPAKPFKYYGGEGDNKIIGFVTSLAENGTKLKETVNNDAWTTNKNIGKSEKLTKRNFNGTQQTIFVKKPKPNQTIADFTQEEMKSYELKNKIINLLLKKEQTANQNIRRKLDQQIKTLQQRCTSPVKILSKRINGRLTQLHLVNQAVYDDMIADGKSQEEAMKSAQRVSYDVLNGKTWQQYNEYVVTTPFDTRQGKHNRRKSLETIGMFIDTRKPVELSRQDKEKLKKDIKNFIEKKQKRMNNFPVFKIGADNKMTKLNSLKEINQVISTFPDR